jgi:thiamine pyrophosphokinase
VNALIVAAGKQPPEKLLLERAAQANFIIAADGGLFSLARAGVTPHLIVGDLDSASRALADRFRGEGSEYLPAEAEKNETDSFLAVEAALDRGAGEIVLMGATGGRLDHTMSNMMLLKWTFERGVRLMIEDETQTIEIGCGDISITGRVGQTVSLLPVDSGAVVTAAGLYYPLKELLLTNKRPRGVSNLFAAPRAALRTDRPVFIIKIKAGDRNIP